MRFLICGLITLFLSSALANAQSVMPREGWQVFKTDIAYSALIERLAAAIKAEKMGLVTQASASVGAEAQGFTIPGNRVIGVYRNDYARRMLAASVAAGIEAPIRFYVTEDEGGGATLSWKTPSFVFAPYMDEGGDDLKALAAELDGVFDSIAERALGD
ncbi:DUF302 domain-containing protein [Hoeflea prorocentri]|uniref:DUF302 domain-containing protein n=1 Tax=Hoeflea prorocentri TaxID=1922333 RepID=A0A9X3UGZ8_9HYPH|nr:DUF302 domain-containing protein [Hoeflea prorocentri]MCY6380512.1 DUF302 domain-containing protein [Hoeflea prorocentri]MDA5398312.1 DUF302 domain-containing protein [Hoeflea prorocentri]